MSWLISGGCGHCEINPMWLFMARRGTVLWQAYCQACIENNVRDFTEIHVEFNEYYFEEM